MGYILSQFTLAPVSIDTTPGGAANTYAQPGGVFTYRQPDGIGLYIQP